MYSTGVDKPTGNASSWPFASTSARVMIAGGLSVGSGTPPSRMTTDSALYRGFPARKRSMSSPGRIIRWGEPSSLQVPVLTLSR